ncbi:hypothetical protein [Halostreptopolyspora alba]|uniref:hypothetical protein n=1 Tax=Halostreptopolyspora alba TaxID=2487137 RepID=UPI0011CD3F6B
MAATPSDSTIASGVTSSVAGTVVRASGRTPSTSGGAPLGGVLWAVRHWHATGFAEPLEDVLDRDLTLPRSGFELQTGRDRPPRAL